MAATREMLEGEAYWGRIRLLKSRLYLIEAILILAVGLIIIFFGGDLSTSPFFIAIDRLLLLVLVMLFVIMIEGIVFRIIQTRIAKSESTKHIMTINSMRKALIILILAVIVAVLFTAPFLVDGMQNALSKRGVLESGEGVPFLSGDPMGLSEIDSISLHSAMGATVYLLTEHDYENHETDWTFLRTAALNSGRTDVDPDLTLVVPKVEYMYLYIVLDSSMSPNGTSVDYTLHREFTYTLTSFLPVISLAFAIANAAWISYLWPLRRKFADKSIYK